MTARMPLTDGRDFRTPTMNKPNARLRLQFDLDLQLPPTMATGDHTILCRALCEALGATVLQGLPTISARQLGKIGVQVLGHHHHTELADLTAPQIPAESVSAVNAHLTDDEIARLCVRAAAKAPTAADELARYLRRQGLAMVGEYRLVPCTLSAIQSSGAGLDIPASLNLTNGSVILAEQFRKVRLKAEQAPICLKVAGIESPFQARLSGHTLSGPVLDVAVCELVAHRRTLIDLWQRS